MFLVFQIGAREHYAVARALAGRAALAGMVTDFWVAPGHFCCYLPGSRRLRDRYDAGLAGEQVWAPNMPMLAFEAWQRGRGLRGWDLVLARNAWFQRLAVSRLKRVARDVVSTGEVPVVFSYSYAALEIFRFAKARGWVTVLGQIDPGPEEERIVAAEHVRYPALGSRWAPAPASYWDAWREEVALGDHILVNSEWSRTCLAKEGVPEGKMKVVPLVYEGSKVERELVSGQQSAGSLEEEESFGGQRPEFRKETKGEVIDGGSGSPSNLSPSSEFQLSAFNFQLYPLGVPEAGVSERDEERAIDGWCGASRNLGPSAEFQQRVDCDGSHSLQCNSSEAIASGAGLGPIAEQSTKNKEQGTISSSSSSVHSKFRIQNSKFTLLFLGQINLRKGIARLLEAMRLLRGEGIELVLAGPSEVAAEAWSDLPEVRWVGPVPRSAVGEWYRSADLFILPTLSDGYALTQLEALSYGLPVMASRCCGEAVTHGVNGWLLDDLEPGTIAQALRDARDAGPLPSVAPPRFGMKDLAERLLEIGEREGRRRKAES